VISLGREHEPLVLGEVALESAHELKPPRAGDRTECLPARGAGLEGIRSRADELPARSSLPRVDPLPDRDVGVRERPTCPPGGGFGLGGGEHLAAASGRRVPAVGEHRAP
jgi:hypothetical protein